MLSFLNVGKRITSSSDNYLLLGSNAKENGLIVRQYVLKLISDIEILEKELFTVAVNKKPVLDFSYAMERFIRKRFGMLL